MRIVLDDLEALLRRLPPPPQEAGEIRRFIPRREIPAFVGLGEEAACCETVDIFTFVAEEVRGELKWVMYTPGD